MPSQGWMLIYLAAGGAVMAAGAGLVRLFSAGMKKLGFKKVPDEQDKK